MEYIKHFDKVLELTKDGPIATINFCCPENENRVHQQLADELYTALRDVHYDSDTRVLVLRAEGEVFLGTGDLQNILVPVMMNNPQDGLQCMSMIGDCIRLMYTTTKPIIAAVDGACKGGGCGFTLSADIVIGTKNISFDEGVFARVCLPPDCGGLWSLQRLVGPMKAKYLALRKEIVEAQEALELGLVVKIVEESALYTEAYDMAKYISALSPVGVRAIKQISNRISEYTMESYFQQEHNYVAQGAASADFKEFIASMQQQRPADFKGY